MTCEKVSDHVMTYLSKEKSSSRDTVDDTSLISMATVVSTALSK